MRFLLDAGHGGMCFDTYLTRGKQSPEVPPGVYEGEFNRRLCNTIVNWGNKLKTQMINSGPINISLRDRVEFVNAVCKKFKDVALLSIHANAEKCIGWGQARGITIFTAKNPSKKSEKIAHEIMTSITANNNITTPFRGIKTANFTILKNTSCPSILIECGFMTNKEDCKLLNDSGYVYALAYSIIRALRCVE